MSCVGDVRSRSARHISYDHYDSWSVKNNMLTASIHHWKKKTYGILMFRLKRIIAAAKRSEEEESGLALRRFAQCWCEKHVFACVSTLSDDSASLLQKCSSSQPCLNVNVCVCYISNFLYINQRQKGLQSCKMFNLIWTLCDISVFFLYNYIIFL